MTFIFSNQAEKTSTMATSAIRNWWNVYRMNQLDTSDSNTEEDEEELAGRKLSKSFSQRLYCNKIYMYTICDHVAEMII